MKYLNAPGQQLLRGQLLSAVAVQHFVCNTCPAALTVSAVYTNKHTHTDRTKHTHTHTERCKGRNREKGEAKSLYTMQNCVRPHLGRGRVRNHRRWCCQRFVPPLLQRAAHFKSCNNSNNNKSSKARRTFRGIF